MKLKTLSTPPAKPGEVFLLDYIPQGVEDAVRDVIKTDEDDGTALGTMLAQSQHGQPGMAPGVLCLTHENNAAENMTPLKFVPVSNSEVALLALLQDPTPLISGGARSTRMWALGLELWARGVIVLVDVSGDEPRYTVHHDPQWAAMQVIYTWGITVEASNGATTA